MWHLAETLRGLERCDEAEPFARRALHMWEAGLGTEARVDGLGPDQPGRNAAGPGRCRRGGRHGRSVPRRRWSMCSAPTTRCSPRRWRYSARARLAQGEPAAAEPLLLRAMAIHTTQGTVTMRRHASSTVDRSAREAVRRRAGTGAQTSRGPRQAARSPRAPRRIGLCSTPRSGGSLGSRMCTYGQGATYCHRGQQHRKELLEPSLYWHPLARLPRWILAFATGVANAQPRIHDPQADQSHAR